jgi:hypothetical protein
LQLFYAVLMPCRLFIAVRIGGLKVLVGAQKLPSGA